MAIKIKSIVNTKELSSESSLTPVVKEAALEGIRSDFNLINKLIAEKHRCLDKWLSACLRNDATPAELRDLESCYRNADALCKKHCESMEQSCYQLSREAMQNAYKREEVQRETEAKGDCNIQAVSPTMSSEKSAPKLSIKIETVSFDK